MTTAALYPPGSQWTVQTGPSTVQAVTADSQGRLSFAVTLGPVPLASYLAAIVAPGPSDPAASTAQITIQPASG